MDNRKSKQLTWTCELCDTIRRGPIVIRDETGSIVAEADTVREAVLLGLRVAAKRRGAVQIVDADGLLTH